MKNMETRISVNQLLPALQALPRTDKLHIVLFLITQLAQEEGIDVLKVQGNYLDWKLFEASSAANTLLNLLAEDKPSGNQT